jgi:hypothetical protein
MPVSVTVLFDQPRQELASLLTDRLRRCQEAYLVAGFMTSAGMEAISEPIGARPDVLTSLVIGAGTYKAFLAFDGLLRAGVAPDRLRVHLGFGGKSDSKSNPIHRYRPMLHSKVYLFEMGDGTTTAFVGSHNLTGFALLGQNAEAGLMLEGPSSAPEFGDLKRHIAACRADAVNYDPAMKDGYAWWFGLFADGMKVEIGREPTDAENIQTIVLMVAQPPGKQPTVGDVIYFEMPKELMQFRSLAPQVHLYVFDPLPPTPDAALHRLETARLRLNCVIEGLQMERAALEIDASFHIDNRRSPDLKPTSRPFRPKPAPGMQQVTVRVAGSIPQGYDYFFDKAGQVWQPVFDQAAREDGRPPGQELTVATKRELLPRVGDRWLRVQALERTGAAGTEAKQLVLLEAAPASGSFIVLSLRRQRRAS